MVQMPENEARPTNNLRPEEEKKGQPVAPNEEPRVRPMSQTEIKQLACLSDLARRKIRDVP